MNKNLDKYMFSLVTRGIVAGLDQHGFTESSPGHSVVLVAVIGITPYLFLLLILRDPVDPVLLVITAVITLIMC